MINLNAAFEDELYFEYLKNPNSVSPEWQEYFQEIHGNTVLPINTPTIDKSIKGKRNTNKNPISNKPKNQSNFNFGNSDTYDAKEVMIDAEDQIEHLEGLQADFAEKLNNSLMIPTASSVRTMPVKALDENRRVINRYLENNKRKRVSFTHLMAWAIIKAVQKFPHLNDAYAVEDGQPVRIRRKSINVGLAVDITKNDGTRLLMVPSIKNSQNMDFAEFVAKFSELIDKTRNNELTLGDLQNTTITLTNPGMIGTTTSSPRLMPGQGSIIATGSIDYPIEFQAVRPELLTSMAVSKVVTITNTYDHRIIHGAESAEFLAHLNKLLTGHDRFYEQIFYSLGIPFEPIKWANDNALDSVTSPDVQQGDMVKKGANVMRIINAYRVRGHLLASMNPLGNDSYYYPELDPAYYGFTIWDLDRVFDADGNWSHKKHTLRDIIEIIRESYCGSIGIEFMHMQNPHKKEWVKVKVESSRFTRDFDKEERKHILKKLISAETFEHFLHTKFIGHKRFSLEGAESMIVMLEKIFQYSADNKINAVVLGMAHRGRLNVLANIVSKSYSKIFKEFDGDFDLDDIHGSGDVKYHLGDKGYYTSPNNNSIPVLLSPNPSHLELVDPVIVGMARALDNEIGDETYTKNLPIIVHGDAAFAGQGLVAEVLNLSELEAYKTGGTIHIIVNNQIGFTTSTDSARSTVYATDVAKMLQIPILHVNGNDPEAVVMAAEFACEFRQKFNSDVIIDMLCYRKYGHNEGDEPSYTQPLLYKKIKNMDTIGNIYKDQLIYQGYLTKEEADDIKNEVVDKLNDEFNNRNDYHNVYQNGLPDDSKELLIDLDTSISMERVNMITEALSSYPEGFNIHDKVKQILDKRNKMVNSDKPSIDWALAESIAFGSILIEGKEIRFSGQDSRRGTFSQRHAVLTDIFNENEYIPLNEITENQKPIRIFDSPLSEMAVMGFEYGYSVISQNGLTIWEAQFGDFTNNAQSIIDQFISCAEIKWGQRSNLILLLPHSYDGQGPEHSSARLERHLQACSDQNMIVGNFTLPSQYFHALRRQIKMKVKVPMILMTPKSMLRNPLAVSSPEDLVNGSFQHVIDDDLQDKSKIKNIVLVTGKLYWELLQYRTKNKIDDTALIRVEQLYPLRTEKLEEFFSNYKNAENLIWVQEEPQNMGAYNYMLPHMYYFSEKFDYKLLYRGRRASASTATGYAQMHNKEQKHIWETTFIS